MKSTIGIVGIGLVGTAMAHNLLNAGVEVYGYDISDERLREFRSKGGIAVSSPRMVAENADRILLSVHDSDTVREAIFGSGGVLEATPHPKYIVDTTTGDPEMTVRLSAELQERGIGYLDATISGSSDHIRSRRGVFMVGGESDVFETCRDILELLAETHFHVGGPGSGSKTKLASNLILGLNRAALAEGLVLAENLGLDLASFLEVVRLTPAYSAQMDSKGEKMIKREYTAHSKISQHRKDVDIILRYGRNHGQRLPFSEVHHNLLTEAERVGRGDLDNSAVIEQIRDLKDALEPES